MAAAAAGGLRKIWLAEPHNEYGGGWRLMAAAPMSTYEKESEAVVSISLCSAWDLIIH